MSKQYNEQHITGYRRDLEKIRARPSLYIGPTDGAGIFTVLRECLDNAVDEARADRNTLVNIFVEDDGSFWVQDKGIGIPVKMHPKMKISTLTHVLTNLQSSGKMVSSGAYKSAIGTHGVGLKGTNALAEFFEVWTYRDTEGGWYYTRFEESVEKVPVKKAKPPKLPDKVVPKQGTIIRFKPSVKFFGKSKLNIKDVVTWCEMTSYMNAGLTLKLSYKGKTKTWMVKDGIKAYLARRVEESSATPLSKKPIFHNSNSLEMAILFTDLEGSQMEFFTNTVRNIEEGVHADDMYRALMASLKPWIKARPAKATKSRTKKVDRSSSVPFTISDLKDGMLGLLNYKIDAPQFDSQTKEKLVDQRVKGACYEECLEVFNKFWDENQKVAKDLIARATELRKMTSAFLKDKRLAKNVSAARNKLSTKLAPVVGNTPPEQRELFLVEGDSAGGSLLRARNKRTQAVYPLRGKPLNVMSSKIDKIAANEEIAGLLAALGINFNSKDNGKVPYGKIIITADPDVDGHHISSLLLGALWKFRPELFKDGKVFSSRPPLYKCRYKGKLYFGMTKEAIVKQTKSTSVDIQYIKGIGELAEGDLYVIADPQYRRLYKITQPDKKGIQRFQELLGPKPLYRKKLLGIL